MRDILFVRLCRSGRHLFRPAAASGWVGVGLCIATLGASPAAASPGLPPAAASSAARIQGRQVRGTVTDGETGQPVAQAQIQVKGTTNGAITRDNGEFTLEAVSAEAVTLVVRRIGYKQQQVAVSASQATVQVVLEHDVLHLEQTIITGQATVVKKENVANDIAVVNADQLGQVVAETPLADLEGKVAGAQIGANSNAPGGGMQIQLRGASSLIGSSDPLYVVDGVVVSDITIQGGVNAISKSGSRTAIASDQDNGTNRLSDLDPNDIASIEILKGASAAAIYGSKAANGVVVITTKGGHVGKPEIRISQKFGFSALSNEVGARNFTSLASAETAFGSNAAQYYVPGVRYDHEDEMAGLKTLSYATNLSVSGGSDNSQYWLSGVNEYDGGIVPNTFYRKQAINIKLQQQLGKKLSVTAGLNLLHTGDGRGLFQNDNVGATEYAALSATPSFFNEQANADGIYPTNPFVQSNALQTANLFRNEEAIGRGIGSATATWHVLSSGTNALNLVASGGADYFNEQNNIYSPPTLQYEILYGNPGTSIGTVSNNLQTNLNVNLVDVLTPANGAFSATTSIGVQEYTTYLNEYQVLGKNLTGTLQNVNTGTISQIYEDRENVNDQGGFLQEEFLTLHDRLLLTAGIRADRSSNDANVYKWFYYPKASASYRVPGSWAFIDGLKLRAAYGESGNEPLWGQKFGELQAVNYQGFAESRIPATGTVASPELQPERQTEFEFGTDLTLFDSTMTLGITGFQKNISNLLLQRTLALQTGFTTEYFNAGTMRSRGLEIETNIAPVQQRTLRWNIGLTFTKVGQVITSLPVPPFQPANSGFGAAYGGHWVQNGWSPTVLVGSCATTGGGVGICDMGDTFPDYRIGLSNDLNVHRFHFFMNWDYSHLGAVMNLTTLGYDFAANAPDDNKMVNCLGTQELLGSCRLQQFTTDLHVYVSNATFLKLREALVAYNLPTPWLHALGRSFSSAALQIEGRNLLSITHYPGLDPEASNFGPQNVGHGLDEFAFPPYRTFWFGINLGL